MLNHKYMAFHHLDKGETTPFWDHIEKSIDFNDKAENPQGYHFGKGVYLREKGLRSTSLKNKISLLREAKDEFFKSGAQRSGRYLEFRIAIEYVKHAQRRGRLQEVVEELSKATRSARKLGYNETPLMCEMNRIKGLMEMRRENYSLACSLLKDYLRNLSKIAGDTVFFLSVWNMLVKLCVFFQRNIITETI